jgi:hypothetical protein
MEQISDANLLIAGLITLAIVYAFLVIRTRRKAREDRDAVPPNAIIVDGSNVMHWGGDPSLQVLTGVINRITDLDLTPIVVFDSSVGYRLMGRYLHGNAMATLIGLPAAHIYVVHKGVVADEVILDLAQVHGLKVVSNDRFRDWSVKFPIVKTKGRMMRGTWKGGNVVWAKR